MMPSLHSTSNRSSDPRNVAFAIPPRSSRTYDISAVATTSTSRSERPGFVSSVSTAGVKPNKPRRTPIVYPALLSRVAEAFHTRIALGDRVKDGLTYKDAFDGRQAVDKIAYIIKTTDRKLALLLGRALDAQKYFHAVTYDHRLHDSAVALYQFRGQGPFGSGGLIEPPPAVTCGTMKRPPARLASTATQGSGSFPFNEQSQEGGLSPTLTYQQPAHIDGIEHALPTGVFTLLTDCYSPTCSRDQPCYSIACPRRLEQRARSKKPQQTGPLLKDGLEKVDDQDEGGLDSTLAESGLLWVHSVPAEIVNSVSDAEKKRQEAINEVVYSERDFVHALEYLRDVRPLSTHSPYLIIYSATVLDHPFEDAGRDPRAPTNRLRRAGLLEC
jgi:RHO1 GDP-GTP exchange protein 1/2